LKARKVIEVQGNVSVLLGQLLEPGVSAAVVRRHERARRLWPRPGEGVVRRPSARLSCASALGAIRGQLAGAGVRDGA
jgi:hypothetical protein